MTFTISLAGISIEIQSLYNDVYELCRENRRYYRELKLRPTRQNLTAVISRVPEGSHPSGKHFVGFYDRDGRLAAILDLITGYPERDDAYIGWFMVDAKLQGNGIGSQIMADVRAAMKGQGYDYLSLAVESVSSAAIEFWKSQGFAPTGEKHEGEQYDTLIYGKDI